MCSPPPQGCAVRGSPSPGSFYQRRAVRGRRPALPGDHGPSAPVERRLRRGGRGVRRRRLRPGARRRAAGGTVRLGAAGTGDDGARRREPRARRRRTVLVGPGCRARRGRRARLARGRLREACTRCAWSGATAARSSCPCTGSGASAPSRAACWARRPPACTCRSRSTSRPWAASSRWWPWSCPGPCCRARTPTARRPPPQRPRGSHPSLRGRARTARAVLALGAVAASGQLLEDAGATWSPLYLRGLGAAAAVAGAGFIALQSAQTVARLLGDRVVLRFGDRPVARSGRPWPRGDGPALPSAGSRRPSGVLRLVGIGIGALSPRRCGPRRPFRAAARGRPGAGDSVPGVVSSRPIWWASSRTAAGLRLALAVVPLAAAGAARAGRPPPRPLDARVED